MDLVRKSSGGIEGKLRFEKERAAWRRARNDAVRLDLKADFSGLKGESFFSGATSLSSKTLKSNCSMLGACNDNGWSSAVSEPGGDDTGVRERRVGRTLFLLPGVWGVPNEESVSVAYELHSEGMDSRETVLVESTEPIVLSQSDISSDSRSSGAIKRISNGLLLSVKLNSFSDSCALSIMDSTVILFSILV
jgi:hypothetical protein